MSVLDAAWDALVDAAMAEPPNPAHTDHATMALLQLAGAASPEQVEPILERAAEIVRSGSLPSAAVVGMAAGALIEHGLPGKAVARALLDRMPEVLDKAAAYADAVETLGATGSEDMPGGSWVGDAFVPPDWLRDRYQSHPDQVVAWHELRRFCLPLIAAGTRDRVVLNWIVGAKFGESLPQLRHIEPHARFLHVLSELLVDAPFRFLDAESGRVFDLRVDGVATNFELHTLLIAALAEPLELEPPDSEIVACLRGHGPRQLLQKSHSAWALYTHAAYADLLQDRRIGMDRWIWNESIPAEIPELDGTRVIVAGPQSYEREWETGRTFQALGGVVEIVAELTEEEAAEFRACLDPQ